MPSKKLAHIPVPLPESRSPTFGPDCGTKLFQAHVSERVYQACKTEWRKRGLTSRQVALWALQNFLLSTNPAAAKKVGLKALAAETV